MFTHVFPVIEKAIGVLRATRLAPSSEIIEGLANDAFLKAISMGAVFFGALTYIGNGPNFMVKAIAEENGIKMP